MILKDLRDYINNNFSDWATAINAVETNYEIDTGTKCYVINVIDVNKLPMMTLALNEGEPKFTTRFDYIWNITLSAFVYDREEETVNFKAEMYLRSLLYGLYQVPQGQVTINNIIYTVRKFIHLGSSYMSQGRNFLSAVELNLVAYVNNFRT